MDYTLYPAVLLLVLAVAAAALGLGDIAGTAIDGARILTLLFIALILLSLMTGIICFY